MLTQNELKLYSSLLVKKYRQRESKFIVEGKRLVNEALKSKYKCEIVIVNDTFDENESLRETIIDYGIRIETISDINFQKLTNTKTPQGIVAALSMQSSSINNCEDEKLVVALEDISDPGNVGTIIRTCDWFGISSIIVSPESVDLFNPKVIRSTMGSLFHVNVYESDDFYSDLIELKKKGRKILCSDMNGENIFTNKNKENTLLILSNEAHGPSEVLLKLSDEIITIPRYGNAESLNVASAAAVIIAQLIK